MNSVWETDVAAAMAKPYWLVIKVTFCKTNLKYVRPFKLEDTCM